MSTSPSPTTPATIKKEVTPVLLTLDDDDLSDDEDSIETTTPTTEQSPQLVQQQQQQQQQQEQQPVSQGSPLTEQQQSSDTTTTTTTTTTINVTPNTDSSNETEQPSNESSPLSSTANDEQDRLDRNQRTIEEYEQIHARPRAFLSTPINAETSHITSELPVHVASAPNENFPVPEYHERNVVQEEGQEADEEFLKTLRGSIAEQVQNHIVDSINEKSAMRVQVLNEQHANYAEDSDAEFVKVTLAAKEQDDQSTNQAGSSSSSTNDTDLVQTETVVDEQPVYDSVPFLPAFLVRDDEDSNLPKIKAWVLSNHTITVSAVVEAIGEINKQLGAHSIVDAGDRVLTDAEFQVVQRDVCVTIESCYKSLTNGILDAIAYMMTAEGADAFSIVSETPETLRLVSRRLSRLFKRLRNFNSLVKKIYGGSDDRPKLSICRMFYPIMLPLINALVVSDETMNRFDSDFERQAPWIWEPNEPKSRHYSHINKLVDDYTIPLQLLDKFQWDILDGDWGLWALVREYSIAVADASLNIIKRIAESASKNANNSEWKSELQEIAKENVGGCLSWIHDENREYNPENEKLLERTKAFTPFFVKTNTMFVISNSMRKHIDQVLERYSEKMTTSEDGQAAIQAVQKRVSLVRKSVNNQINDLLTLVYVSIRDDLETTLVNMLATKWTVTSLFSENENKKKYTFDMVSQVVLPLVQYLDDTIIWMIEPLYNELFTQLFEMIWRATVRVFTQIVMGENEVVKSLGDKQVSIISALMDPNFDFSLPDYFHADGKGVPMDRLEKDRKKLVQLLEWQAASTEAIIGDLKDAQERMMNLDKETQEHQIAFETMILEAGVKMLSTRTGDKEAQLFLDTMASDHGDEDGDWEVVES